MIKRVTNVKLEEMVWIIWESKHTSLPLLLITYFFVLSPSDHFLCVMVWWSPCSRVLLQCPSLQVLVVSSWRPSQCIVWGSLSPEQGSGGHPCRGCSSRCHTRPWPFTRYQIVGHYIINVEWPPFLFCLLRRCWCNYEKYDGVIHS